MRRWQRPDDRGAVGVTFAILLASGVLLGALALVVDVGRLYVERGELQNGADAAALAIARACAADAPQCGSTAAVTTLAARYANLNAQDGHSAVDTICGEVPGGFLPACGPQPANLTGCLGEAPADQYVEVHVSTLLGDGTTTILPPAFAQTLAGGNSGTTVGACARAAWGPADLTILAVTISVCEFQDATADGTRFADIDHVRVSDEHVIQFWSGDHATCGGVGPGWPWQRPGPAGFLDGGGAQCRIGVSGDGVVTGSYFVAFHPYDLAPANCENRIRDARASGQVIYLPVHDAVGADGSAFRHVFVAPFRVTAYQFGTPPSGNPPYDSEAHRKGSVLGGARGVDPCGTPTVGYRCLTGAFVGDPIPIEALTGDHRIRLVG